jgi:hypothetical protein
VLASFYQIVDEIKRKPYDLLDYTKNTFDRDYLEFNVNIHDLDSQMQVGVGGGVGPSRPAGWHAVHAGGCLVPPPARAAHPGSHVSGPIPCSLPRPLWTRRLSTSPRRTTRLRC